MWQVSSRSGVAALRTAIHLLLTYLLAVYARSTFPALCSDQSLLVPSVKLYRRRPGLPGRRTDHLEQPAGQRDNYLPRLCQLSVSV